MDVITRIFCGPVPHPASGSEERRGAWHCLIRPKAELPPDFPQIPPPELMLKESGSVAAYLCSCGHCFVKIGKYKGFGHGLRRIFRVPRFFRAFCGAEMLREAGFHTPQVLAAAVRFRFGIVPVQQQLLTEALPENTVYLDKVFKDAAPGQIKEEFLRLVRFAARLHQAGFQHGDMSLRNFYRQENAEDFGVIDLDGILHYPAPVPRTASAAELARLAVSAFKLMAPPVDQDEWLREMLTAYHQSGGIPLAPEDLQKTMTRLMKHRYHGPWSPLKNP